jgi:hypothetical protein
MARAPTPPPSTPPHPSGAAPQKAPRELEKALSDLIRAGQLDRAAHVILQCIRKDPHARFRNCEELHEELSALAASAAP